MNETTALDNLQQRLNHILHDQLQTIALVAAGYYVALAILHALSLPADILPPLLQLTLASALLSVGLWAALRARPAQARDAHAVLAIQFGLALINHLALLYLSHDIQQTLHVALLIIAAGLLTLSSQWLTVLILAALGSWALAAPTYTGNAAWLYAGFGLLCATGLAVIAHRTRRTAYERAEHLHQRNQQQAAELRRRTEQMDANLLVGQQLNAGLPLNELLNTIADLINTHYRCSYVGIFLLNRAQTELVLHAAAGEAGHLAVRRETTVKLGRGIIGWVARHRQITRVDNTAQDARFIHWDLMPDTAAELALPIKIKDQLLGVLDMQSDQANAFEQADLSPLELLGEQIAFAIQNARIHEQERYHQHLAETLYRLGRALARPSSQQETFQLILQQLLSVVPHDRSTIFLRDGDFLKTVAVQGFPENKSVFSWRVPIRPGDVFDEICRTQHPLVLVDALRRAD
ncbi:MAG TPA: GAF domain-containing protein, partial [Anaerolineae bacterium]|nr:GAF domain-containing protein [Anaerolineae bacterium]